MASRLKVLPKSVMDACNGKGPPCKVYDVYVQDLSDYFAVFNMMLTADKPFWFRGHSDLMYRLIPSALRYKTEGQRNRAIELLAQFRRMAEIKLEKPPALEDELKWLQIAQHYGLPTRLLDWTENAATALYFACRRVDRHGLVAVLNPIDLNRTVDPKKPRVFDAHRDAGIIMPYLCLTGRENRSGRKTIAIHPILNSERIVVQKGVFTLHGTKFALDNDQAKSLVYLPIVKEVKERLLVELDRVGINEMSVFPELEHICTHLKKKSGLD